MEVKLEVKMEVEMEIEMEVEMDAPILPSTYTGAPSIRLTFPFFPGTIGLGYQVP